MKLKIKNKARIAASLNEKGYFIHEKNIYRDKEEMYNIQNKKFNRMVSCIEERIIAQRL